MTAPYVGRDELEMKEQIALMEGAIVNAKWNMYADSWEEARAELYKARAIAISLRDKAKVDEILGLLKDVGTRTKPKI